MDIEHLISQYLDGDLTPEAEAELHHLFAVSPEARGVFRSHIELRNIARDERILHHPTVAMRSELFARLQNEGGFRAAPLVSTAYAAPTPDRSAVPGASATHRQTETTQTVVRRRRRRLVPALLLVMLGIISSSILFQPGSFTETSNGGGTIADNRAVDNATTADNEQGGSPLAFSSTNDEHVSLSNNHTPSATRQRTEAAPKINKQTATERIGEAPLFALADEADDKTAPLPQNAMAFASPAKNMAQSTGTALNAPVGILSTLDGGLPTTSNIASDAVDETLIISAQRQSDIQVLAAIDATPYRNEKIIDDSISDSDITNETITAAGIATGAVGSDEVGDMSLTYSNVGTYDTDNEIIDESITADDIGPDAVGSSEIIAEDITLVDIGAGAVGNVEIMDRSVITNRYESPPDAKYFSDSISVAEVQSGTEMGAIALRSASRNDYKTKPSGGGVLKADSVRVLDTSIEHLAASVLTVSGNDGPMLFAGISQSLFVGLDNTTSASNGNFTSSVSRVSNQNLLQLAVKVGIELGNNNMHQVYGLVGGSGYREENLTRDLSYNRTTNFEVDSITTFDMTSQAEYTYFDTTWTTASSATTRDNRVATNRYELWGGLGYRFTTAIADSWTTGGGVWAGLGKNYMRIGAEIPVAYRVAEGIQIECLPSLQYIDLVGTPVTTTVSGTIDPNTKSSTRKEEVTILPEKNDLRFGIGFGVSVIIQ